jgi:predicted alpha/beta-hydrolase family hydrolase
MSAVEIETPHGLARAYVRPADAPKAAVALGHGAGGGVQAPDLQAAANAAIAVGCTVALVEQPYLVAGRRSPTSGPQLDAAWLATITHLRGHWPPDVRLIAGGRSLGARVACRTAAETGAVAVLCLAFPFRPPRRRGAAPAESRQAELDSVTVPVLVVQGSSDPFGMPEVGPNRSVVAVPGTHSLGKSLDEVSGAVSRWLERMLR